MDNLAIIWAAIVAIPLVLGFMFAKIERPRAPSALFWTLVFAPIWIWTFTEIVSPPSAPPGHFERWSFGMALLIPVIIVWMVVAIIAFIAGRRSG